MKIMLVLLRQRGRILCVSLNLGGNEAFVQKAARSDFTFLYYDPICTKTLKGLILAPLVHLLWLQGTMTGSAGKQENKIK